MLKRIAWVILLVCSPLACMAGDLKSQPEVGETPPPLLGKLHGGDEVDLANYKGKVVIVTFWASWCGPCRKELPVLAMVQETVGHEALEVIAVNFKEPRKDFLEVVRLNRKFDLNYVHDSKGITSDAYGVQALPNMFILDQDGKVAHVHRGYSDEMLESFIAGILALLPEDVLRSPARNQ